MSETKTQPPASRPPWVRTKQAMQILSVSAMTLHRWRNSGVIESKKKGNTRWYNVGRFFRELDGEPEQGEANAE